MHRPEYVEVFAVCEKGLVNFFVAGGKPARGGRAVAGAGSCTLTSRLCRYAGLAGALPLRLGTFLAAPRPACARASRANPPVPTFSPCDPRRLNPPHYDPGRPTGSTSRSRWRGSLMPADSKSSSRA